MLRLFDINGQVVGERKLTEDNIAELVREYIAKKIPLKWVPSIALERVPASEPVIFSY